jgi:hypothetical protein
MLCPLVSVMQYCTALHCTILYYIVLYYIVLYCDEMKQ